VEKDGPALVIKEQQATSSREIAEGLLLYGCAGREWPRVCRWASEPQTRQNKMGATP